MLFWCILYKTGDEPQWRNVSRTFLWQAPPFAQAWSAVQHFAFGAGGGCGGAGRVSVLAQRIPPARVSGWVLAEASLGLGLEPSLVHGSHWCGNPVSVDLVIASGTEAVLLTARLIRVTQIFCFCRETDWTLRWSGTTFHLSKNTRLFCPEDKNHHIITLPTESSWRETTTEKMPYEYLHSSGSAFVIKLCIRVFFFLKREDSTDRMKESWFWLWQDVPKRQILTTGSNDSSDRMRSDVLVPCSQL